MNLSDLINKHRSEVETWLNVGRASWSNLLSRIEAVEAVQESDFNDEQIWTFLLACGYAIAAEDGVIQLYEYMQLPFIEGQRIWFEVLPLPPRGLEGNTNLDLALGAISTREGTKSGIDYNPSLGSSIAFFEFKWYSDISTVTSHDLHRNQLARVIDTAITFESGDGVKPERVQVVLVSPSVFKDRDPPSRFYAYKFEEYSSEEFLLADLRSSPASVDLIHDYAALIPRLELIWRSYEELIEAMPSSDYRIALIDFAASHAPNLREI